MGHPLVRAVLIGGTLILPGGVAAGAGSGGHGSPHGVFLQQGPRIGRPMQGAFITGPRQRAQSFGPLWQMPPGGSRFGSANANPGKIGGPCGPGGCRFHRYVPGMASNPYGGPASGGGGAGARQNQYYQVPPIPSANSAIGGPGRLMPAAATAAPASAGRYRYACTINRNQPDAGGACVISSPALRYSGGKCSCHGQAGTID